MQGVRGYGCGPLVILRYIISDGGVEQSCTREIGEEAMGRHDRRSRGERVRWRRFFVEVGVVVVSISEDSK